MTKTVFSRNIEFVDLFNKLTPSTSEGSTTNIVPGWRNWQTHRTCLPAGRLKITLDNTTAMITVYAIKSLIKNYIYVGQTDNLQRRLEEHNKGKNRTTKPYKPFKLILREIFKTRIEARKREKYLKSGCGREYLKKSI